MRETLLRLASLLMRARTIAPLERTRSNNRRLWQSMHGNFAARFVAFRPQFPQPRKDMRI
jgi:hypothetical protein